MDKSTYKQNEGTGDSVHGFGDVFSSSNSTKDTLEPKIRKAMSDSADHLSDFAVEARNQLSAKGKEAYKAIDRNARSQPWSYIAGATVLGLALGYYMTRRGRHS